MYANSKVDIGRIIEFAPNLIYVYDQVQHKNVYTNQCIGKTLGYSVDDVKDMGADLLATIMHPDDLADVFTHFAKIRELEDGQIIDLEYRVKHKAGHWVWLLSHDTVFLRDDTGKVTQHIGATADITAQKAAEAAALAAEARTNTVNEELQEFAYAVSHDMKAPSNTIKLILNELEQELKYSPDATAAQLIAMAHTTVDRMQRLVEDVLHYTQFIGQQIDFENIDLNVVFSDLKTVLKADAEARHAKVIIDPMPVVKGSETQLMILFQNLMQNALKFSRPNIEPVIRASARKEPTSDTVVVSIEDNGIGIPSDKADQIFKLFKRLNTDQRYNGTGLGLATCRRIALNHHTSVSLTSTPDEGSTFSIELEVA